MSFVSSVKEVELNFVNEEGVVNWVPCEELGPVEIPLVLESVEGK